MIRAAAQRALNHVAERVRRREATEHAGAFIALVIGERGEVRVVVARVVPADLVPRRVAHVIAQRGHVHLPRQHREHRHRIALVESRARPVLTLVAMELQRRRKVEPR
jgi:hypothetical protein